MTNPPRAGVFPSEGGPPHPSLYSTYVAWVGAAREAGYHVPKRVGRNAKRLITGIGWTPAEALDWLEAQGLLARQDRVFGLHKSTPSRVGRHVNRSRLPTAWYKIMRDGLELHFPEAGDLNPAYGYIYEQNTDGSLGQNWIAQGTVTVPRGLPLMYQAYQPGRYGRPFEGLPPDVFDRIIAVAFAPADDDDMEAIADLHGARTIELGYVYSATLIIGHGRAHKVSDEGMRHLAGFDRLETFGLKSKLMTDDGLAVLADKPLRRLQLAYAPVTAEGVARLDLGRLTTLTLEWMNTIGLDLRFLGRCDNLESLGLRISGVTDDQLRNVAQLSHLRTLDLGHNLAGTRFELANSITDRGVSHLRTLTSLTELLLPGTAITDASAQHIRPMTHLNHLSLYQTPISDRFLADLGPLAELEVLDLDDTNVTGAGMRELVKLPRLKRLSLLRADIGGEGLSWISQIPSLEYLSLNETNVTADELRRLEDLPNLKRLDIWDVVDSPNDQASLQRHLPDVVIVFDFDP